MSDDLKLRPDAWGIEPASPSETHPLGRGSTWVYQRQIVQIPTSLARALVASGQAVFDEDGILHFLPWTAKTPPLDPAPWQVFT